MIIMISNKWFLYKYIINNITAIAPPQLGDNIGV